MRVKALIDVYDIHANTVYDVTSDGEYNDGGTWVQVVDDAGCRFTLINHIGWSNTNEYEVV